MNFEYLPGVLIGYFAACLYLMMFLEAKTYKVLGGIIAAVLFFVLTFSLGSVCLYALFTEGL